SSDGFLLKLDPSAKNLIYSTYFGGRSADEADAIALDDPGNAYITGGTESTTIPVASGQTPFQSSNAGASDAFVAKIDAAGRLLYSTFLGGTDPDVGAAIAVDTGGNTYVAGQSCSSNFPVLNPFQSLIKFCGGFLSKLNSDGSALVYSTYLSGTADTAEINAIAVDATGSAHVTGNLSEELIDSKPAIP